MNKKAGFVAIIGPPNSGKSTLLNALIKQKISIMSPRPQTTRYRIEGIYQSELSQIVFVDTPGFIKADKGLEHILQIEIEAAIANSDVIVLLFEPKNVVGFEAVSAGRFADFINKVKGAKKPFIVSLNKIDLLSGDTFTNLKERIISTHLIDDVIGISALNSMNLEGLIDAIERCLPESEFLYDPEQIAIKSERFLCQELIREQLFYLLNNEVPYECAVSIEEFDETDRHNEVSAKRIVRISAVIIVSRESLKPIIIGRGGEVIKKIGTNSRKGIEDLLSCRVFLNLRVIVKKNWVKDRFFLKDLGYEKV